MLDTQYQAAIIVVTHDEKIVPALMRLYNIRDGQTFEAAGQGRALECSRQLQPLSRFRSGGKRARRWHPA
jgi:ABC-type lipoprotein export system ATPase subunit